MRKRRNGEVDFDVRVSEGRSHRKGVDFPDEKFGVEGGFSFAEVSVGARDAYLQSLIAPKCVRMY